MANGMTTPRPQTTMGSMERKDPAQEGAPDLGPPIDDGLSAEDRASIERGLAQSHAGIRSTDAEVEAAFALFRR